MVRKASKSISFPFSGTLWKKFQFIFPEKIICFVSSAWCLALEQYTFFYRSLSNTTKVANPSVTWGECHISHCMKLNLFRLQIWHWKTYAEENQLERNGRLVNSKQRNFLGKSHVTTEDESWEASWDFRCSSFSRKLLPPSLLRAEM